MRPWEEAERARDVLHVAGGTRQNLALLRACRPRSFSREALGLEAEASQVPRRVGMLIPSWGNLLKSHKESVMDRKKQPQEMGLWSGL